MTDQRISFLEGELKIENADQIIIKMERKEGISSLVIEVDGRKRVEITNILDVRSITKNAEPKSGFDPWWEKGQ